MEKEQKELIELCRKFANTADALEKRAFENGEYQKKGFYPDFNALFEKYAYGKENRLLSDFNFRSPPRYSVVKNTVKETITPFSENKYLVTFEGEPKLKSLRFTVEKIEGNFKLLYYETYVGISNHGADKGQEIWRRHKL